LDTFADLFAKGGEVGRKSRNALNVVASLFNKNGVVDALYKTAFLSVQNQIVCVDDLERAGKALEVRDVLGLISFLKEERSCKVVLLLNDERLGNPEEFRRQLEKVVDVQITFEIAPREAVDMSLGAGNGYLADRIVALGITNIRVIKKLERLTDRVKAAIGKASDATVQQAISTTTLAGWAVMQPDDAPPIEFVRSYNGLGFALRNQAAEPDEEERRWSNILGEYGYGSTDQFDEAIIRGVEAGHFDTELLLAEAKASDTRAAMASGGQAFSAAWENLYHGSLASSDEEFLDALHTSAIAEAAFITPLNINSAIRILKDYGRPNQAQEVLNAYFLAHAGEAYQFFDISEHHFSRDDPIDPDLQAGFEARLAGFVDKRDPFDVASSIGESSSWSKADIALLARLTVGDFVNLLEKLRGRSLRRTIQNLQLIGTSAEANASKVGADVTAALLQIGQKSPLRARKVSKYGVIVPTVAAPATKRARPKRIKPLPSRLSPPSSDR
jgi:hypothetical protein